MTAQSDIHPAWYVLHTRSRFEQVVFDGLEKKSLETFLPKITVMSKRRDRRKKIRVPLFPGYVFIRSDLNVHERLEISWKMLPGNTRGFRYSLLGKRGRHDPGRLDDRSGPVM